MEYYTVFQTLSDRFSKKEISRSAYKNYLKQLENCRPTIFNQEKLKILFKRILRHGVKQ